MTIAGVATNLVLIVGLAAAVLLPLRSRARARKAEREWLAASWESLILERDAARANGVYLVQAVNVYQLAQRGSKAIIRWMDTGVTQDAWFWNWHIPPGSYLLVRGGAGYGPHNNNPNVLYVRPEEVHRVLPGHAPAVWQAQKQAHR
ncbi:hypothetical protein [Streptomyces sp. NBC_01190]|uniref:hypothetical protein n=1 Tax=Streptomyces sp. NBC_01190 TaxID=2903767 RepID=UPI0038650239|nr:hypothetical protein OG519_29970 [Streptomyces sp. NBC_01190]